MCKCRKNGLTCVQACRDCRCRYQNARSEAETDHDPFELDDYHDGNIFENFFNSI